MVVLVKKLTIVFLIIVAAGIALYWFTNEGSHSNGNNQVDMNDPPSSSNNFYENNGQIEKEVDIESKNIGNAVGQIAPDFSLETLDDEVVHLSDYRGKKIILQFWTSWCPHCKKGFADMNKLHKNEEIQVLGIDIFEREKSISDVVAVTEEYELSFPVLIDTDSRVQQIYGVSMFPTTYLIDSSGLIYQKFLGAVNADVLFEPLSRIN